MTMHKAFHPRDDIDCMYKEKEKDVLKIVKMYQYKDKITKKDFFFLLQPVKALAT